jgi:hypothetical protein
MSSKPTRMWRKHGLVFWALLAGLLGGGAAAAGVVAAGGDKPLPPAKQRVLDQQAAARASARVVPHVDLGPPPPSTLPARVPGIVSTGLNEGPFPPGEFTVSNVWTGPFAGVWYLVYAGEALNPSTGDPVGGGIRIYSLPIDPNAADQSLRFVGAFAAPGSPGKLTIATASGNVLTLSTDSGSTLRFDLATNTFG